MIQKLPQEVINQIAAGEVIERPSSVIKELVDNSIDAGATKIDVKIKEGGVKYIEVSDNGCGIKPDEMHKAFEAHATSKIQKIEDLNEILSMGFRGEALSTIVSVSNVQMISKTEDGDFAYKITGQGVVLSEPSKTPREKGTTLIVENLFGNIPARLKYMRAEATEYRKVLEILIPFFLIYPNINFTFTNNGKVMYSLPSIPNTKPGDINNLRVENVLKSDFSKEMLQLFYNGDGVEIIGLIAKPQFNYAKTVHQYFFLNHRPILDRGVIKAVMEGYSRYIPHGQKVPFILSLNMKPSLVDVNVHPRKEEVRFMNPFRVYSAVEASVQQSLKDFSKNITSIPKVEEAPVIMDRPVRTQYDSYPKEVNFKRDNSFSVKSGMQFSEALLKVDAPKHKVYASETLGIFSQPEKEASNYSVSQMFNKYIFVEFEKELWVVDQHAAAERINYEKIKKQYDSKAIEVQKLLMPDEINMSETEVLSIGENIASLESFGFKIEINGNKIMISEVPAILSGQNLEVIFKELVDENADKKVGYMQESILATLACHSSIRSGQKLYPEEMRSLVDNLQNCENGTSCPHGRPITWKLKLEEIDSNFYRTY